MSLSDTEREISGSQDRGETGGVNGEKDGGMSPEEIMKPKNDCQSPEPKMEERKEDSRTVTVTEGMKKQTDGWMRGSRGREGG